MADELLFHLHDKNEGNYYFQLLQGGVIKSLHTGEKDSWHNFVTIHPELFGGNGGGFFSFGHSTRRHRWHALPDRTKIPQECIKNIE